VLACVEGQGSARVLASSQVVIATGGLGGLYEHSTNPAGAVGQGLMLAAKAGAALADLEFVQFHPTALDVGQDPMPLVSEAVRGEGAILVDDTGARFMAGAWPRAELEPRDIVSRAVWARMQAGHRVFLDTRPMRTKFSQRFPGIAAVCRAAGIDPDTQPIPIRPAAHYHMGGIAVDAAMRTSLPGLWAVGEAACTGLHGANRLASNSLLEAAVTGRIAASDIAAAPVRRAAAMASVDLPSQPDMAPVRRIMSAHAGVLRDADGLRTAIGQLLPLAEASAPAALALMMCVAMRRREESRGGHARTDYPEKSAAPPQRVLLTLEDALIYARSPAVAAGRAMQGGAVLNPVS
jgi:L-aspartate oxidase